MALIGSKGGKKSKRKITPKQQKGLIAARKRKFRLRKKFDTLAEQWKKETAFDSDMPNSPAYKKIIAMGKAVVPFMLKDFQDMQHNHWFYALEKITGEDPIPKKLYSNIPAMAMGWVDWGIKNKIIKRRA
jgi:hypothetical protein